MKKSFIVLSLVASVGVVQAQSLTTTFTSNNSGASLWTMYFDATATQALTITALDVNVGSPGVNFTLDIYTRAGTYSGNETNGGSGWTLVSTGSGVSAGNDTPSNVDICDFVLGTSLTGVAIRYNGVGMHYTNGNGSNQNYSNADLALALGTSAATTAGPFAAGSSLFNPRVW